MVRIAADHPMLTPPPVKQPSTPDKLGVTELVVGFVMALIAMLVFAVLADQIYNQEAFFLDTVARRRSMPGSGSGSSRSRTATRCPRVGRPARHSSRSRRRIRRDPGGPISPRRPAGRAVNPSVPTPRPSYHRPDLTSVGDCRASASRAPPVVGRAHSLWRHRATIIRFLLFGFLPRRLVPILTFLELVLVVRRWQKRDQVPQPATRRR